LVWLHTNHLGAPEAATDAAGHIVWRASYAPFGAATVIAASASASAKDGVTGAVFQLNLRLPGQVFDPETGLHHNRQRYYDPQLGQYLTPDPLGTPDGPNPYAYVAFNPLTNIDPDGLVLFAFDGTENSDPALPGSSFSNVVEFRDRYDIAANGPRRYVTGVGTVHTDQVYGPIAAPLLDAGISRSGIERIDRMMLYLRDEAIRTPDTEIMQIDIIGFSRGAAQARDFANQAVRGSRTVNGRTLYFYTNAATNREECQWVNFRFMGLWDTVLSTNVTRNYEMNIPTQFAHVAHAVALNEYRSQPHGTFESVDNRNFYSRTRIQLPGSRHWGGFPLVSIGASASRTGQVRIERGFIGAHADIGGGYGANENGLSTVALSWMVGQAQIAGVTMRQPPAIDMNNPVVHDQSNVIRFGNPRTAPPMFEVEGFGFFGNPVYRTEDRLVQGAPSGNTQRTMGFGPPEAGGNRSLTNADSHQFIIYDPRPVDIRQDTRITNQIPPIANSGNRTGRVDMQGYMSWLRSNGYVFAGTNP
jgi:RHS repeat-associated protein